MRSNRPASLAFAFVISTIGSVSADVIASSGPASMQPLAGPPIISRPGPGVGDRLDLTEAMASLDADGSPLLRRARENGLASSTLDAHAVGGPAPLAHPGLPEDALRGASTRTMVGGRSHRDPEVAPDSVSRHNIRIPEPASLTLVAAGLIGLLARRRLRRDIHARKVVESEPV